MSRKMQSEGGRLTAAGKIALQELIDDLQHLLSYNEPGTFAKARALLKSFLEDTFTVTR